MDGATLKRLFEPFFTTRAKQGGTGLGLASAYGILRNHGGYINAFSEPGKGTTFNIYLPASEKKIDEMENDMPANVLATGTGGILVIDDEPMILSTANKLLSRLGYTVFSAINGQEAVSIYRDNRAAIKLVILDMVLPGMKGGQILEMLREIEPQVNVILSSGYSLQGEVQKLLETGCCGFIQKPFTFEELSRIIRQNI